MNDDHFEMNATESPQTDGLVEEKFYLAVNDNLMSENKKLKKNLYNIEKKFNHIRHINRLLIAALIFVLLAVGFLFMRRMLPWHTDKSENKSAQNASEMTSNENASAVMFGSAKKASVAEARELRKTEYLPKISKNEKAESMQKQTKKQAVPQVQKTTKINDKKSMMAAEDSYNSDPRVRTGAYRIVGISTTVTVCEGQTLSSISRTKLGPGMECYVEAVNGGIHEVSVGQKIKIPILDLKIKRK